LNEKVSLVSLEPILALPSKQTEKPPELELGTLFYFPHTSKDDVEALTPAVFRSPFSMLEKCQKYCKETVISTSYVYLLQTADDLVGQVGIFIKT